MVFIKHQGRIIHYRLLGAADKPLLVLAHPLGMNHSIWDGVLADLLPGCRVLTWDLPGHGASAAWPQDKAIIEPEDLAQEVLLLVDLAQAEYFHFAGTSIGGVVGQQLLSEHAQRLLSATLTNTGAVIGTRESWQSRSDDVRTRGLAAMAAEIVPRWFGEQARQQQPDLLEGWQQSLAGVDTRSYALLCDMLGRTDFTRRLANRRVPLQLIGGTHDLSTPPATLQALAECSHADNPVILENIGHIPSIECPQQLSQLLLTRLKS